MRRTRIVRVVLEGEKERRGIIILLLSLAFSYFDLALPFHCDPTSWRHLRCHRWDGTQHDYRYWRNTGPTCLSPCFLPCNLETLSKYTR